MDEKYSLNLTAKMNKFSRMFEHSGADKRMNQVEIVAKCSSSKKTLGVIHTIHMAFSRLHRFANKLYYYMKYAHAPTAGH